MAQNDPKKKQLPHCACEKEPKCAAAALSYSTVEKPTKTDEDHILMVWQIWFSKSDKGQIYQISMYFLKTVVKLHHVDTDL